MTWRGMTVAIVAVLFVGGPAAGGQIPALDSADAAAFIGTWAVDMTEPTALVGTNETVRISEKNGFIAASLQFGKFPPNNVTGIMKDGDLLVLTTTLRENGQPIWVVVSLKLEGETMILAQMMERSQTIKRGMGKRRAD